MHINPISKDFSITDINTLPNYILNELFYNVIEYLRKIKCTLTFALNDLKKSEYIIEYLRNSKCSLTFTFNNLKKNEYITDNILVYCDEKLISRNIYKITDKKLYELYDRYINVEYKNDSPKTIFSDFYNCNMNDLFNDKYIFSYKPIYAKYWANILYILYNYIPYYPKKYGNKTTFNIMHKTTIDSINRHKEDFDNNNNLPDDNKIINIINKYKDKINIKYINYLTFITYMKILQDAGETPDSYYITTYNIEQLYNSIEKQQMDSNLLNYVAYSLRAYADVDKFTKMYPYVSFIYYNLYIINNIIFKILDDIQNIDENIELTENIPINDLYLLYLSKYFKNYKNINHIKLINIFSEYISIISSNYKLFNVIAESRFKISYDKILKSMYNIIKKVMM